MTTPYPGNEYFIFDKKIAISYKIQHQKRNETLQISSNENTTQVWKQSMTLAKAWKKTKRIKE